MNDLLSMMRTERLRYAIKREVDRQAIRMSEDATAHLVDAAARNIDAYFDNDDMRGDAAEQAEKTLNPVIAALAQSSGGDISLAACRAFLASRGMAAFPWTIATPK